MMTNRKIVKLCKKGCFNIPYYPADKIDVSQIPTYSDLKIDIPSHGMEGIPVRIEDILNIPIVVLAFKDEIQSKFLDDNGNPMLYAVIQFFYLDDENQDLKIVHTASKVLREKLNATDGRLPFIAKIIKVSKHYQFQ